MIFALATHADLDAIAALEEAGFDHARWSADAWRGELDAPDRHVLVAREVAAGEVIAVATFSWAFETADLLRVVVRADRRGRGVARRLIRAGIEWASGMGATRVLLEVETTNAPALALYQGLGFRPLARRADYYGVGHDALVMELVVSETATERSIA